MLAKKKSTLLLWALLILTCAMIGLFVALLSNERVYILLPSLVTIIVFIVFSIILKRKVGDNLFGELGFVYLSLAVAYTIFPAFTFLAVDLNLASGWVWEKLALLLPSPRELGVHLWRHVIFVTTVGAGYLLFRGRVTHPQDLTENTSETSSYLVVFLIAMIFVCILSVAVLSAPVKTYIDNYTRFDHLSWLSLRYAYACMALKTGSYFVLMTILFWNYKKFKFWIIVLIPILCVYELTYSLGSRIETLAILLGVVCLYHFFVKNITIKMGLISLFAIALLFSVVELFRSSGFDSSVAQDTLSREGGMPASEFGAVYFTSFHLYSERVQGALPHREWPMFFNDFISIAPFVDHTKWNPQYWYARHYFPDSIVPPQTMGPIAESAIWGGEVDLIIRGLINGAIFAYLVRWFLSRKTKWWAVVVYVYCYANCVMTLKYSIFYQLTPLLKILLPTLLVVWVVKKIIIKMPKLEVFNSA